MRTRPLTFALLLFAGAFALRMALVLTLRDLHQGPVGVSSADDVQFDLFARQIAAGQGLSYSNGAPTSFRAPGWPFVLAGLYSIFGISYPLVYVLLCLLGASACVLAWLLARELTSEPVARLAGVLTALYLPHVYFSAGLLSEALFVPLLALGLWLFVRYLKQPSWALLVLSGLVLSAAALTRPFTLLLAPILAGVLLVDARRHRRAFLMPGLLFGLAFVACIVPWTVRNHRVHGRFVLIATNGGSTFYGGNNDRVVREWRNFGNWLSTTELPHRDWIDAQPDEVSHDKMEWHLGVTWLRENWKYAPLLVALKTARLVLWLPDFDGGSKLFYAVRALGYLPFLLLFLAGLWAVWRDRNYCGPAWLALHGTLVATLLTAWIFWGSPRFRDANAPLLMIYAAVGAHWLLGGKKASSDSGEGACSKPMTAPAKVPEPVSV